MFELAPDFILVAHEFLLAPPVNLGFGKDLDGQEVVLLRALGTAGASSC